MEDFLKERNEILDKLKSNNYPFGIATIDIEKLLDYITNLQEENERLTNELNTCMIERNNFLSRNEKAIEYIKPLITDHDDGQCYPISWYCKDVLLGILQGSDKE